MPDVIDGDPLQERRGAVGGRGLMIVAVVVATVVVSDGTAGQFGVFQARNVDVEGVDRSDEGVSFGDDGLLSACLPPGELLLGMLEVGAAFK